jgi:hypothetical protein
MAVGIISTVPACTGATVTPPAPLRFSGTPSAVTHSGELTDIPIRVTDPSAVIHESGALPTGLAFRAVSGAAAAIVGTPEGGSGGQYPVDFTATDGTRHAVEHLMLTVSQAPAFPAIDSGTFAATSTRNNWTELVAVGYPAPVISYTGTLPSGFSFATDGAGTIKISGSPGFFEGPCDSQIVLHAVNSAGATAFPLTIKIGNVRCICNLACSIFPGVAIHLGKWIINKAGKPVGRWIVQGGKATWRLVTRSGAIVSVAAADAGEAGAESEA